MSEQLNQTKANIEDVDPTPLDLGGATPREERTLRILGVESLTVVAGEGDATERNGEGKIFVGPLKRTLQGAPFDKEAS